MHYRAVFISDLHLGTPGCQAEALLDFLKSHSSDHLYLVGDIIDGWQLRRKWYWPQAHNDVVQKILRRVRKGCHVVYVPGNHDEFARDFVEHQFGGIEVLEETSHTMLDGRRLCVCVSVRVSMLMCDGEMTCTAWHMWEHCNARMPGGGHRRWQICVAQPAHICPHIRASGRPPTYICGCRPSGSAM